MRKSNHAFLVGIGSNIDPYQNVPRALNALMAISRTCAVSKIIETEPIGMIETGTFLNLVVYLETGLAHSDLKTYFNEVEASLGRDRSDPKRGVKSRPIDLDIITEMTGQVDWRSAIDEVESYYRPMLVDLLSELGIEEQASSNSLQSTYVNLGRYTIGGSPVWLSWRQGHVVPMSVANAEIGLAV